MTIRSRWPLLAPLLLATACEPAADSLDFTREPVAVFRRSALVAEPAPNVKPALRVLNWNVKYGAGRIPFWFDCFGDRVQMSPAEVEGNMAGIYRLINEVRPDIFMAQEIELNSRRSAYYDMIRGVLENTGLNYAAYFESWDSRYVASEGLGRINLGVAIFSRYPIVFAERIRQEDRTDQDPLTKTFYIHRVVGRAEIETAPGARVAAMVVHAEAYDQDGTKVRQIAQIHELMKSEPLPFVAGGDFNELPPTAARIVDFPDERTRPVCSSDYAQPPYTPQVMQKFYDDFNPYVPLERYGRTELEQRPFYTHSVLGPDDLGDGGDAGDWNRTLDYLFIRKSDAWTPGTGDVIQRKGQRLAPDDRRIESDVLRLSDHAPVTGVWEVR
jgi:endonuclease/exonuclease/phosphatase family metal-dependent hydrolase